VQDITERKQAEEAVQETDRRKDEFSGHAGHELRNPLPRFAIRYTSCGWRRVTLRPTSRSWK